MTEPFLMPPADAHNQRLVAHVDPATATNAHHEGRYNLVVIGAGTAGLVAAAAAAGLGARVALIERHLMGGDCLNYGCVPSKALLRSARAAASARADDKFGVRGNEAHVDFGAVMERMRRVRADLSVNDAAARFADMGVDLFKAEARFVAPDQIDAGGKILRFRRAVIATGARAGAHPIQGLAEAGYLTNETVFALTELPRRLAVIGAGPVGCELAQAFQRFGSEVILLELMPRILPNEDEDAAARLTESMTNDGVRVVLRAAIERVALRDGHKVIHLTRGDSSEEVIVDGILLGVGRVPNLEHLDLASAGIAYEKQGVTVDDRLRTSNPRVFAAGDICSAYKFTHMADAMARIVIRNALFHGRARVSDLTIPWCIYTDPEIAQVGLTPAQARQRSIPHRTFVQEMREVDRAVIDEEIVGFVKILVHEGSDRIIGATIVARHASEMINALTLAIAQKIELKQLANLIYPYPTQSEAIKKLADAYNRARLTPRAKRLFDTWFRWQR